MSEYSSKYQATLHVDVEATSLCIGWYVHNFNMFDAVEFRNDVETHFESKTCMVPVIVRGNVKLRGGSSRLLEQYYSVFGKEQREIVINHFVDFV